VPKRSIGDSTVQTLMNHAQAMDMPLYSAMGDLPEELGSRPRKCVTEFFNLMTTLSAMKDTMDPEAFVTALIQMTGLEEQYAREDTEEAKSRVENIHELLGAVHEYVQMSENPTLEEYLENVSLVTDLDRETDSRGYVTMMTLHSAKGLEFDNVFIPGMEENIFPSMRSISEENRLEEERRLMYVGITRARKRLFLCHASEKIGSPVGFFALVGSPSAVHAHVLSEVGSRPGKSPQFFYLFYISVSHRGRLSHAIVLFDGRCLLVHEATVLIKQFHKACHLIYVGVELIGKLAVHFVVPSFVYTVDLSLYTLDECHHLVFAGLQEVSKGVQVLRTYHAGVF
jgi:hypothetical protein